MSDLKYLQEAYEKIVQVAMAEPVVQVPQPQEDHGCDSKEMAQSNIESISRNIQSIYANIHTVERIEPWVAEKITLANDYLNTVQEWLDHQTR